MKKSHRAKRRDHLHADGKTETVPALAHHLDPIFQIGKGGISDELVRGVGEALEARELIKVSILQNNTEDREETARQLAEATGAELVQVIGRTIVLYRESRERKTIELP